MDVRSWAICNYNKMKKGACLIVHDEWVRKAKGVLLKKEEVGGGF